MTFCPWYPLAEAAAHAPAGEGVLQIRLATGLVDYPAGKSAMVHYEHAADCRARAVALAARFAGRDLLCRHLESPFGGENPGPPARHLPPEPGPVSTEPSAIYAKVRADFVRRFGAPPAMPS